MNKKILIVDDEPDILMTVSFRLKKAGYQIITAEDGNEAIEKAKESNPDLILLDLRLPGKDGIEVFTELKSEPSLKEKPIIFLTASSGLKVKEKLKDLNHSGFMTKPFEAQVLIEKIKSLLG